MKNNHHRVFIRSLILIEKVSIFIGYSNLEKGPNLKKSKHNQIYSVDEADLKTEEIHY